MVALFDSMGISKMFNVMDNYSYYSSEKPLYPDVPTNLRLSFSQVGETNAKEVALEYFVISRIFRMRLKTNINLIALLYIINILFTLY